MDMMDSHNGSSDMCKGLDQAISMLQEYQSNPEMITPKTIGNVITMLQKHKDQVMGESKAEDVPGDESESEDSAMPKMLDTPYRSDNMKRPNPFQRKGY